MAETKTVTLRTRQIKNGMLSFYLDYYPGYREQETMKRFTVVMNSTVFAQVCFPMHILTKTMILAMEVRETLFLEITQMALSTYQLCLR